MEYTYIHTYIPHFLFKPLLNILRFKSLTEHSEKTLKVFYLVLQTQVVEFLGYFRKTKGLQLAINFAKVKIWKIAVRPLCRNESACE